MKDPLQPARHAGRSGRRGGRLWGTAVRRRSGGDLLALTPCRRELLDSLTLGDYLATRPPRAVISITAAEGVGAVLRRFACAGLVRQQAAAAGASAH